MRKTISTLATASVVLGAVAFGVTVLPLGGLPAPVAQAGGDHHHGPKKDLGKQGVAGYTAAVAQLGEVKAGGPLTFEIVLSGGGGKPKAVRAWVGDEKGDGSVKVKAVDREKFYDADLEVPDPLPAGSKLWVEVETDAGKSTASFDTK